MTLSPMILANSQAQSHPEALEWAQRAVSNGGIVTKLTLLAVSNFCRAIDAAGLRSSMCRLNLFCGGNLSGCLVPLYRSTSFGGTILGNAIDTNANFISTDFTEVGVSGGLQGSGVNKYLNTGLPSNSLPSATSVHMSCSGTNLETSGDKQFMGSFDNGGSGLFFFDTYASGYGGRTCRIGSYQVAASPIVTSPGASESHMIGTRTSSTMTAIYRGGILAVSNTTSVTPTRTVYPFYIFVGNTLNNAVTSNCSAGLFRMYSIGSGLDATQASNFSSAVITFNTTLGRA